MVTAFAYRTKLHLYTFAWCVCGDASFLVSLNFYQHICLFGATDVPRHPVCRPSLYVQFFICFIILCFHCLSAVDAQTQNM